MSKDKVEVEEAANNDKFRHVTLDNPITRGEMQVSEITISKPFGPALRGLKLASLVNDADFDQYRILIPRITNPQVSLSDIDSGALSPSDMLQIISEVTDFLFRRRYAPSSP